MADFIYLVRVEVGIENYHRVRTPKVDAYTSSACTEHVDEDVRVGLVELIHALLAVCLFRAPVLCARVGGS